MHKLPDHGTEKLSGSLRIKFKTWTHKAELIDYMLSLLSPQLYLSSKESKHLTKEFKIQSRESRRECQWVFPLKKNKIQ